MVSIRAMTVITVGMLCADTVAEANEHAETTTQTAEVTPSKGTTQPVRLV